LDTIFWKFLAVVEVGDCTERAKVSEDTKHVQKPQYDANYNHNIEDIFDFGVHGEVRIYQP
jgi:hypothetical protein